MYLLLPVKLRRLLGQLIGLAIVAIELANEGDDVVFDVVLALEHVELYPVSDRVAQEGQLVRLSNYILDYPMLPSNNETPVFQEGQTLDNPILGLVPFIVIPLLRREKAILVSQAQILAKQAAHLRLGSNPEVTNDYTLLILLEVHSQQYEEII